MSERKAWRRLLVEGVVIVGSILLAFSVDAWWDRAKTLAEEREVLSALHVELSSNRQTLDRASQQIEEGRAALERFLVLSPSEVGELAADSLAITNMFRRTFYGGLAAGFVDAAIQSGVGDTELRAALAEYARLLTAVENSWSNTDDLSRDAMQLLGRHRGLQDPAAVVPDSSLWQEIRSDSVLVGVARAKWVYWGSQRDDGERLSKHVDALLSLVESRLRIS
ncbi:MAG: hypothetical protein OEO79_17460 [Gemmatimonadota bacterium]|nr:hypothetical protein [Gemmatimonadota bacterium]